MRNRGQHSRSLVRRQIANILHAIQVFDENEKREKRRKKSNFVFHFSIEKSYFHLWMTEWLGQLNTRRKKSEFWLLLLLCTHSKRITTKQLLEIESTVEEQSGGERRRTYESKCEYSIDFAKRWNARGAVKEWEKERQWNREKRIKRIAVESGTMAQKFQHAVFSFDHDMEFDDDLTPKKMKSGKPEQSVCHSGSL